MIQRFHRVAGDATPGTGLGLAIVQAIVGRHHGTIELSDAQPGAERPGLLVTVRLPSARGPAKAPESRAAESPAATTRSNLRAS